MARGRAEAPSVLSDGFMFSNRAAVTGLALKSRLPSIFPNKVYSESGGLMSYGPNLAATFGP